MPRTPKAASTTGAGLHRPGRHTKLTADLAAKVVAFVRAGSFANVAARASGIGESTYYRWLERGESCETDHAALVEAPLAHVRTLGKERGLKCSRWGRDRLIEALLFDEYPFWEFRESVKEAEAEAEISRLVKIESAADEHWQAAAWWLERKYSDRYGRTLRTEVSGPDGGAIRISGMSDEELLQELAKLDEME